MQRQLLNSMQVQYIRYINLKNIFIFFSDLDLVKAEQNRLKDEQNRLKDVIKFKDETIAMVKSSKDDAIALQDKIIASKNETIASVKSSMDQTIADKDKISKLPFSL